jgi:hypothetical protein
VRADLTSWTDVAQHALYDASVPSPTDEVEEFLESSAPDGQVLVVTTTGDGELHWCVFVDEQLPDRLRARVKHETRDVLLRVPTGQLRASGLEKIGYPADGTNVEIPAGTYLVDAYELDFDWDHDIEPALERELGAGYKREGRVGLLGAPLFWGGLVCAAIGVFGWRWRFLAIGVGMVALALLILALFSPKGDYQERKRAIEIRFPFLVLVLRQLPAGSDVSAFRGAILYTEA